MPIAITGLFEPSGGADAFDLVSWHDVASHNWAATTAPTVNDDSGDGYVVGSLWLDTTADKAYVALDVTVGAAVWREIDTVGHEAAADPHTGYQKESEKDAASGYAGLTAGVKLNLAQMQEVMAYADLTDDPVGTHAALDTGVHGAGVSTLATEADIATHAAIATAHHTNANDPTADEKAALAGTSGAPSGTNKYVTNADSRNSDARTPTAHGAAQHTGKIGERQIRILIPLKNPLAVGTGRAVVDYEHKLLGSVTTRIRSWYVRAASNITGDTVFKLYRNGVAITGAQVTVSSGTRESAVDAFDSEVTLADGDYLDVEEVSGSTQDIAVDAYVLGDEDVLATV